MGVAWDILRELTDLNRVFCSTDYDRAVEYLRGVLPFESHTYTGGGEHNGWVIPPKWDVIEARILRDGKVVYDGLAHPLGVMAVSAPFRGRVCRDELRRHLHYDHRYDDAIPFHFRQQYRSWDRDWGFCVPKRLWDALEPGDYDVVIETRESAGTLRVLEHVHAGEREESFVFLAHLDHPGMANDGLAACAVGAELFARLRDTPTKWTYRLIVLPEILGSEYYWGRTRSGEAGPLLEAVFLDTLGSATQLALQASAAGESNLERSLEHAMHEAGTDYRKGAFRSIICNDEHVWEAYGIPTAGLSRSPYPEYHSSLDSVEIISEAALAEAVDVLRRTIAHLETCTLVRKRFRGTVCLSNPRFDLYVDPGQPAFGTAATEEVARMRRLMELIPTLRGPTTVESLADQVELDVETTRAYLERWAEKGLLELS